MKARVTDLNKYKKFIWIDLIDYNNNVHLHTQVCCSAVNARIYYKSSEWDSEKEKCIFVKNIGKIIGKAFLILGYDESKIESIVFRKNAVNTEYASIIFRREKQ